MRWMLIGLLGGALMAGDAQARKLDLSYVVYFGGFSVGEFETNIRIDRDRYRVVTNARSAGMLDFFFPIDVTSEGTGALVGKNVQPGVFRSNGTFDGEPRRILVQRRAGAVPDVEIEPPRDPEKRDAVPDDLQRDTLDPYAALISLAVADDATPCDAALPIFNGRTRTDFRLMPAGSDNLPKSEYSAFSGAAERCEIEYETLAGGYKKPWFGDAKTETQTHVWVARLTEDGPWIPVRLESEGPFGLIVGHITGAALGTDIAQRVLPRQ